jgi:hypothetical protein
MHICFTLHVYFSYMAMHVAAHTQQVHFNLHLRLHRSVIASFNVIKLVGCRLSTLCMYAGRLQAAPAATEPAGQLAGQYMSAHPQISEPTCQWQLLIDNCSADQSR